MYVEVGGERYPFSCQTQIAENLHSILKKCAFSQADVTFITRGDPTKPITIVISYELKRTPEKSGAT
jgi:hypothetical protein